tara:strand:- start:559 stop:663 length:105 start_codon:yes stop_codon:yes gene_type:complete
MKKLPDDPPHQQKQPSELKSKVLKFKNFPHKPEK